MTVDARNRLIRIIAERIVADWRAQSALETPSEPSHNPRNHDQPQPSPATPRRILQPVQLG